MAFDYEAAKAQYGAQRARQMEQESAAAPAPTPAAPVPAAPTNFPPPPPRGGVVAPRPGGAPTPAPSPAPSGLGDLSGFKTYADWQKANRAAGGSGENSQIAALLGGAPGGAAPSPGGAPGAAPGGAQPAGGQNYDAFQPRGEQQQTARLPAGSFPDDHPDAGNWHTGDPYLDELRSGTVAGSEDWRRFSNAELKAWQKDYLGNGRFRTADGGVSDKPTNTTKGEPGGGGGGGGAGGGAGAGAPAASSGAGGGDVSGLVSQMETLLKQSLSGENSRYSSQAMQGLLAKIKQNVEFQRQTQLRQAGEGAAARGMARSGTALAAERGINAAAGASFTNQYADVMKAKIDADRQDKLDALDRSQKYLDSLRDELYRRDMSAIQRQQFQANLDLAYANLKAQRQALDSQQQYGKDMLAAQYGYGATFGGM